VWSLLVFLFGCLFAGWLVYLVGSLVCCIELFGEEGYRKGQVTKDMQQRLWKEWIRI